MTTPETLDCGHVSTPNGCAAGYATRSDNTRICYGCANESQRAELKTADRFVAYLTVPVSTDEDWANRRPGAVNASLLTTWSGGKLATVVSLRRTRHNIGGYLYRFNAIDVHGQHWYGTSPGPNMYARMRKSKARS